MLFTSWTSKNFTELQYDDKGVVTFQCSLHLCQQSSATFEQAHVFPPGNSCSHSWSQRQSILQCLTFGIMKSLQAFCQRTTKVLLWRCEVITILWMLQYCPSKICNSVRGAHMFVPWHCYVRATLHFSCGMNWWTDKLNIHGQSDFLAFQYSCCQNSILSPGREVHRNNASHPKTL